MWVRWSVFASTPPFLCVKSYRGGFAAGCVRLGRVLLLALLSRAPGRTAAGSPEGDRAALGRWRDNRGYPIAYWKGVQLDDDGRVEKLDLGRKQIKCERVSWANRNEAAVLPAVCFAKAVLLRLASLRRFKKKQKKKTPRLLENLSTAASGVQSGAPLAS